MKISTKYISTNNLREEGVASILTVIFFILIASVVATGFLRLSLNEGEQALEDSLSKSALAAAYSGVNDAKRALLYCLQYKNDPTHPCNEAVTTGINNPNCRGFFENSTLRQGIGIPEPDPVDGSIHVGDDPTRATNERYTCVTIANDTYDVSERLTVDQPDSNTTLIPLRSASAFNAVRISWHRAAGANLTGLDYGGLGNEVRANYRDTDAYGTYFKWRATWPAMLKMSLYGHPRSGITYADNPADPSTDGTVNIKESTAYLYPRGAAAPLAVGVGATTPRQLTNCNPVTPHEAAGDDYLCQITIANLASDPAFDPVNNVLYLQLTGMYVDTDFVVELIGAGGNPVKFDDVSPEIDATGAVENTYRRVKVRVRYQGSTPLLPNAVDTGAGICKDFRVGAYSGIFSENCGYGATSHVH